MRRTIFSTDRNGNTRVSGYVEDDGTVHVVDSNGDTRYGGNVGSLKDKEE